jgi:glycosyltransferase involved in cell wall biosynthesis
MDKIKVLEVVGTLETGGVASVTTNILKHINRDKFQLDFLVYDDKIYENENVVKAYGSKVFHIDPVKLGYKKFLNNFNKILEEFGPYHVVHGHLFFHNALILSIAKKNDVPIRIAHSHGTADEVKHKFPEKQIKHILHSYQKMQLKNVSNYKIACSKDAGYYLFGENTFKKSGIIYNNGIEVDRFKYDNDCRIAYRKKIFADYDELIIGSVGRMANVKNYSFLLDVFYEIHKKNIRTKLIMIGDGPEKEHLKRKCEKLGIDEFVIMTGNVNDVQNYLNAMDIVIMPSISEGFPVTLIEQQTCGLRCLVSDSITKDVNITGNVFYESLNNSKETWAETTLKLLPYNRDDKSKIIKDAGFDIDGQIKIIENIYSAQE